MKPITRNIEKSIKNQLYKGKTIILYGARQVGKTILTKSLLDQSKHPHIYLNCDLQSVRQSLEIQEALPLKQLIGAAKLAAIDEAQRIENIGLTLKIIHDTYPDIQLIATGSSSFDLANKINEPMTGRTLEYKLFPISLNELTQLYSHHELQTELNNLLIYGSYPNIFFAEKNNKQLYLDTLSSQYLYKDILELEQVKSPKLLTKLLQLVALQLGSEVSINELAVSLQTTRATVERYLDLLEKSFIIFRLRAFSRNLRKEINKKEKIYFYDLGIRNSLIGRFNPLEFREDVGALWENFCIVERLKLREYQGIYGNIYFWRTHDKQEIDYIEEYDDQLHAYEFKWNPKSKKKIPKEFLNTYKNSSITVIDRNNFWDFLT